MLRQTKAKIRNLRKKLVVFCFFGGEQFLKTKQKSPPELPAGFFV
jgi:hypothetical protein